MKKITAILTAVSITAAMAMNVLAFDANIYDVNADGNINLSDATFALSEYANISAGLQSEMTCDVDGDGKITLSDATLILQYYANKSAGIYDESALSVQFIDVGQADASLLECDGHYMLIDGGNVDDSSIIYSILQNKGIDNLDIVVGTHAHEDHIGGLSGALNYATADIVLCPETNYDSNAFADFKSYAEKQSNGITVPDVGDTYSLGSAEITILGVNGGSETNDTSIILKVKYGDTSFLFTGDATETAEQAVLDTKADLSATVLKVGHHGSSGSSSYNWINEIMPEYAVISVGVNNNYGHPTDAVLSRLRDAAIKTYRTDLNGDIFALSDGKTVTIKTNKTVTDEEIFKSGSITTTLTTTVAATTTTTVKATTTQNVPVVNASDYVVNTSTGKFHYPYCSSANSISTANRLDIKCERDYLISCGYVPCKRCNP